MKYLFQITMWVLVTLLFVVGCTQSSDIHSQLATHPASSNGGDNSLDADQTHFNKAKESVTVQNKIVEGTYIGILEKNKTEKQIRIAIINEEVDTKAENEDDYFKWPQLVGTVEVCKPNVKCFGKNGHSDNLESHYPVTSGAIAQTLDNTYTVALVVETAEKETSEILFYVKDGEDDVGGSMHCWEPFKEFGDLWLKRMH